MPIGDLGVPIIGKNVVIAVLVQTHILIATFILGSALIAPTAEYLGMVTKQPKYERFARNLARLIVLLFATGSALAITFILALITLFPIFFSYLNNIFFWVFFIEAFMFLGVIIILYAWYNVWDKLAYRKTLHVTFGLVAGFFGVVQLTMINAISGYMLTPAEAPVTDVARTFLNSSTVPLTMHRFVGNFSYAGFLIAGWAAWRYLRSTSEGDREYYDWMGHWGLMWGFGFLLLQPVVGFGYFKEIREHNDAAFTYLMLGDKSWLFNLLMIWLGIMSVASVAYCLHKLKFAVRSMPTLRNMTMGSLGFMTIFSLLNVIPSDGDLVPQIGLVLFGGKETKFVLGGMYPWKYIGLIGLMLVGIFVLALYLKAATGGGFRWGRASRWSQYALMITAVTVVLTMMTMGYARETARRATDPDGSGGSLINGCITLDQKIVPEGCGPAESRPSP